MPQVQSHKGEIVYLGQTVSLIVDAEFIDIAPEESLQLSKNESVTDTIDTSGGSQTNGLQI